MIIGNVLDIIDPSIQDIHSKIPCAEDVAFCQAPENDTVVLVDPRCVTSLDWAIFGID
jgi:hypothetical protein